MAWTLAQIKTKIQEDLDLEEETGEGQFIETTELTNNINRAIDEAESIIHTLYEDYFLTYAKIYMVNGVSEYTLPEDIYANKIRRLVYYDGTRSYEVKRMNSPFMFDDIPMIETDDDYKYLLINKSTGMKLVLYPQARSTSSTALTIWYIRNATELSTTSDECDIPEAIHYVIEAAKGFCMAKENAGVIPAGQMAEIARQKEILINTLSDRIPDGHTEVYMDESTYDDHS